MLHNFSNNYTGKLVCTGFWNLDWIIEGRNKLIRKWIGGKHRLFGFYQVYFRPGNIGFVTLTRLVFTGIMNSFNLFDSAPELHKIPANRLKMEINHVYYVYANTILSKIWKLLFFFHMLGVSVTSWKLGFFKTHW